MAVKKFVELKRTYRGSIKTINLLYVSISASVMFKAGNEKGHVERSVEVDSAEKLSLLEKHLKLLKKQINTYWRYAIN
ncbi:hypothetical protein KHA80_13185 [Anaerobacillus sp. HL2]|nr:hypothetical protein KHA80_13185 [Anaerobacillus sp. HL2]